MPKRKSERQSSRESRREILSIAYNAVSRGNHSEAAHMFALAGVAYSYVPAYMVEGN